MSARSFETAGKCSNMDESSKFKNWGVTKSSNFKNIQGRAELALHSIPFITQKIEALVEN